MNLAQAIQQRWNAATALSILLPVSRVFTGARIDASLPSATISKESGRPQSYQSDGSAIDEVTLRVRLLHSRYDDAAAIVHELKKAFDRSAFDLAAGDKVLDMQRVNDYEQQRDGGTWEMIVDFRCTVYLASGV